MKLNKFFLFSAAVGLALASCSDDVVNSVDNGKDVAKGNTYVGLTVAMASPNDPLTKAANTGDGEYEGTTAEKAINDLRFYYDSQFKKFETKASSATQADGEFYEIEDNGVKMWRTSAWQTTPVDAEIPMAVVINKNDFFGDEESAVRANSEGDAAKFNINKDNKIVANTDQFGKSTGFTMSSNIEMNKIVADIDKAEKVKDKASNLFGFKVSRMLSKGMVYTSDEIANAADSVVNVKTGTVLLGQVYTGALTFAGVNGGLLVNAFNVSGKSAIETLPSEKATVGNATKAVEAGLFRMGVAAQQTSGKTNADLGLYQAQPVNLKASPAVTNGADVAFNENDKGVYFFENTADAAALKSAKDNKNGYDRFASAKVYVTYVPATIWTIEYTDQQPTQDADKYTKVTVNSKDYWYKTADKLAQLDAGKKWVNKDKKYEGVKTYVYSEAKGKYYTDKVVAAIDKVDLEHDGFTYQNGRGAYMTLWNRVEDTSGEYIGANTLRNYIYVLEITGFYGRPMNFDPADPDDPNLPKPDTDPENPTVDKDPDPAAKTYMAVKAEVLKWKVSMRKSNLGEK